MGRVRRHDITKTCVKEKGDRGAVETVRRKDKTGEKEEKEGTCIATRTEEEEREHINTLGHGLKGVVRMKVVKKIK